MHLTSYHFWQGNALQNWAAWLARDTAQILLAFVPTTKASKASRGIAGVHAIDGSALIAPFVLCHRDPGSGIKVRAVMELLARGHDVMYSDADVVWFKPPSKAMIIEKDADVAIQIYGNPSNEDVARGSVGLNFGLFFVRSNSRTRRVFRKLFLAMTRSLTVREHDFGLDTCNDQNCLNQLLFHWEPELVCGLFFREIYYPNRARETQTDNSQCIKLQLLDPTVFATAESFGFERAKNNGAIALHMTGYWGGHTFAKVFALQEHGLWKAKIESNDSGQYLTVETLDSPRQISHLMGAMALALLSRRTLILPEISCLSHPIRRQAKCSIDEYFRIDLLLECNRALTGKIGYRGVPDSIERCEPCKTFLGTALFVSQATIGKSLFENGVHQMSMERLIKNEGRNHRFLRLAKTVTIYEVLLLVNAAERHALKQMMRMYFVALTLPSGNAWKEDTFPLI